MQRIDPTTLPLGRPLPANLYDADGRVLWHIGHVVEALDLRLAHHRLRNGLFADGKVNVAADTIGDPCEPTPEDAPEKDSASPVAERRVIDLCMLEEGSTLLRDIYDERGVLLLSAGKVVTARFLGKLRARGLKTVRTGDLRPDDTSAVNTSPAEAAEPAPAATPTGRAAKALVPPPITIDPAAAQRIDRMMASLRRDSLPSLEVRSASPPALELNRLTEIIDAGRAYLIRSRQAVAAMTDHVLCGEAPQIAEPAGVVERFTSLVRTDADAALHLLANADAADDYLLSHALNVSLLTMATANHIGLSSPEVRAVGLGAMVQDLGMLHVPPEIRLASHKLDAAERSEVAMHPLYTLQLLERMHRLDDLARVVAYQSHERCDGSGYPNRTSLAGIHPLARLIAAADTYCALTSARPHRPALRPHDAVRRLLAEAHAGRLDRDAVRALLQTLGAYPVGSIVSLSDGRHAKVIRSGRHEMTRPTVRILSFNGRETDEVINLIKQRNLDIIAADTQPLAA